MKKLTLIFCLCSLPLLTFSQWIPIITDATGDSGAHDATLLEYQYDFGTDQVEFRINTVDSGPYADSPAADFSFQLPFGLDSGAPAGAHWSSTTAVHKTAYIYCDAGGVPPSSYTYAWPLEIQETSSGTVLCGGCVSIFTDVLANQITYTFNRTDIITDTEMGGLSTATIGLVANLGSDGGWDDAITHTSGGPSSSTFTITFPPELTALFTPETTTICNTDAITFTDASSSADPGGITAWNWTFEGGTPATASTIGPHIINYATEGTYNASLQVTDATGTHDTTFVITVTDCNNLVASFTPDDLSVCAGDCIGFVDESTGSLISNWTWTFSDPAVGGPILTADPGTVCFPNEGSQDITLTITNDFFSDDTTVTITVNPSPVVIATESPLGPHCIGDIVTLTGSGAATYNWTGGVVDGVGFSPGVTATYTLTGTNDIGCSSTSDITVAMTSCVPLIAGFTFKDNVCIGECRTLTDTTIGSPISWMWDFGGAATPNTSTEQNPVVCFETPGVYTIQLTVTNVIGETTSTTNMVTVYALPIVMAERDTVITIGGWVDLVASSSSPGGTYIWSPDENLYCENCPITSASPRDETIYTVVYTDANGCLGQNSVSVYVNFIEAVGVASAFSPNDDGNNDVLYVQGYGIETLDFSVYNRYGQLIFHSTTQSIGWDGAFLALEEPAGVYTWVLQYQLENGKSRIQKGNTTLIR